jgi:phage baseplate assembly protein W
MAFKDIDLTFNRSFTGLAIKEDDDAIQQLINDAVKTQIGEHLLKQNIGCYAAQYASGTRDVFAPIHIRDEIYFALANETEISISRSDIRVTKDNINKKFIAKITVTILSTNTNVTTNIVFNYK